MVEFCLIKLKLIHILNRLLQLLRECEFVIPNVCSGVNHCNATAVGDVSYLMKSVSLKICLF